MLIRNLLFITTILASSLGCTPSTSADNKINNTKQAASNKPALGVPVPHLEFASEVRAYMREVLAAPLPADYKLPDDILATSDYNVAVATVGKHFPEFNGLEAESLLIAVKANPYRYQEMILEARTVRTHFFPEVKH